MSLKKGLKTLREEILLKTGTQTDATPRRELKLPQKLSDFTNFDLSPKEGVEALLELKPFGVNLMGEGLPVLILKNETGNLYLPVPLSPMDAGLALSQSAQGLRPNSPHRGTAVVFKSLGLEVTQAVFEEIKSHKQMIRVYFKNHPSQTSLLMPAEDVMTLCLHLEVPLYASNAFIKGSQALVTELQTQIEGLKKAKSILKRNHNFIQ